MQDRRHRIEQPGEPGAEPPDLRESVFGMRWSHGAGHGRCHRCRRPVRAGEAILLLDEGDLYCVLCGRRHWSRSVEGIG